MRHFMRPVKNGELKTFDRDETKRREKYQLRKQEIFKAIKNNRALSGLWH